MSILAAALVTGWASAGVDAQEEAPSAWVIPSGREAQLGALLGVGAARTAGCELLGVRIEPRRATGRYRCGASVTELTLAHVDTASPTDPAAGPFALRAEPRADRLVVAVRRRIEAADTSRVWVRAWRGRRHFADLPVTEPATRAELAARVDPRALSEAMGAYESGAYDEAARRFVGLARADARFGGWALAAWLRGSRDPAELDGVAGPAGLRDLLVGAGALARSREETLDAARLEQRALAFEALGPGAESDARAAAYLALCHLDRGDLDRARELADRAVRLRPDLPEVYYHRAEIVRGREPARALLDLERFVDRAERVRARGGLASLEELAEARRLLDAERRRLEGRAPLPPPVVYRQLVGADPRHYAGGVATVAGLAAALWLALRRRAVAT